MILLGAAGGDIAGSRFEFHNRKSKDFEFVYARLLHHGRYRHDHGHCERASPDAR